MKFSYQELIEQYKNYSIPYAVLLTSQEWDSKRKQIIDRDKNVCQQCRVICVEGYILKAFVDKVYDVPAQVEEDISEDEFGMMKFSLSLKENPNPKFPHVHHTYYIMNKLPWEYANEDLVLLCHICHLNLHQKENIKVYTDTSKTKIYKLSKCNKCSGTGYLYEYSHIQGGICFKCKGARYEEWI